MQSDAFIKFHLDSEISSNKPFLLASVALPVLLRCVIELKSQRKAVNLSGCAILEGRRV